MSCRPRIIPTLLINKGKLVKTVQFNKEIYLGDPINAVKIFNEKGVDELCILDVSASKEGRAPDIDLLERIATEAFMPLSYGGGIRSKEIAKRLYRIGYEKLIFNTALIECPEVVKSISDSFGCQSVVASIDYKTGFGGKRICYTNDGKKKLVYSPLEMAKKVESLGCGELLLYAIDRDGKWVGYDLPMVTAVSTEVDIPVIACGGAKNIEDIKHVLDAGASAAAAGSIFVFWGENRAVLINYPSNEVFKNNQLEMD